MVYEKSKSLILIAQFGKIDYLYASFLNSVP